MGLISDDKVASAHRQMVRVEEYAQLHGWSDSTRGLHMRAVNTYVEAIEDADEQRERQAARQAAQPRRRPLTSRRKRKA